MKKKGFTMLEILIVIIIIAILATFAIPQYLKASRRAIASEAVTTIGALRGAIARYYQEYNTMPPDNLNILDVDNPNQDTNASFGYGITDTSGIGSYKIKAEGKSDKRANGIAVCYEASNNNMQIFYPGESSDSCGNLNVGGN